MVMSRHSDRHRIQTERGGTDGRREKEKENWEIHGRREVKSKRETERRAGAEETLEMTACKYANGGPLKWR